MEMIKVYTVLKYITIVLLGEFGITLIIYLGAALMNGSFNASKWFNRSVYTERLAHWQITVFVGISVLTFLMFIRDDV